MIFHRSLVLAIMFVASFYCGISRAEIHTIDLLVLHPPKSVLNVDILTRVASMETYANKALENSQASIRFRVVKIAEINLPNPKTDGATLNALRRDQRANELRAQYGADLVTMITPTGPYCGVGYILGGINNTIFPGHKNYGFNVVADRCISSFAHELGHNLGLGHSYKQGSNGGLYHWGRGHGVDNSFVTTMAYTSAYKARRLQFFSNPAVVKCKGLSCGAPINQNNGADATKAVGVSGAQIAAWFETVQPVITINNAPHASDDFAVTRENESVEIDVLKNDTDPDQDQVSIVSLGAAKHGVTKIVGGLIVYTPEQGFVGQDNFQYAIDDGNNNSVTAWVTVNVGWGVNYQYYQGQWSRMPDFSRLTPVKEGISHNFSLESRIQDNHFGFRYIAQLDVPESGNYRFFLTSDDGSQLFLDDVLLIDNDGIHTAATVEKTIHFSTGLHRIEIRYFQATGNPRLKIEWNGPTFSRQVIASSFLRLKQPQNNFPVAADDKTSTAQDVEISIDVLGNDSDADGDTLSIVSHSRADNGNVKIVNNQLLYRPDSGFTGTDSFVYQISDGRGGDDTGLVTVHVGQGVAFEYFEGNWDRLPDFDSLTPVISGIQKNFTLHQRKRNDHFAFRYRAHLQVPRDGHYYFFLISDDGSRLNINNQTVVNNEGSSGLHWKLGGVQLTAGSQEIELQYFEKTGRERLYLFWRGPDMRWRRMGSQFLLPAMP